VEKGWREWKETLQKLTERNSRKRQ